MVVFGERSNYMPTIDIGICLNKFALSRNISKIENTLLVSLNILLQKDDITFTSTYIYDEKIDSGIDIFNLKDSLQQIINSKPYNRMIFKSSEKNFFVTIGFIKNDLTIGLNLDYEFFSDILQKTTPISLLNFIQKRLYKLHEKVQYNFVFADFDAEFDYSYFQLLEMIKEENNPYCLLIIDDNGSLKIYKSSYNLLGYPYEKD